MCSPNVKYSEWLAEVDKLVCLKTGVGVHELPDLTDLRPLYDDRCSVKDGAEACLDDWAQEDPVIAEAVYGEAG